MATSRLSGFSHDWMGASTVEAAELPPPGDREQHEAALRGYLAHGLSGGPGDVVLYGTAASIPDPAVVAGLADGTVTPPGC